VARVPVLAVKRCRRQRVRVGVQLTLAVA
jgi:hypothetical protein